MPARARLLKEWDLLEKMAVDQEADEEGGRQVSYQLQMIGLKQQVYKYIRRYTRKDLDEASAQIKQQRKRANTFMRHMANSHKGFGDAIERTQDECKQRLKRQKDVGTSRRKSRLSQKSSWPTCAWPSGKTATHTRHASSTWRRRSPTTANRNVDMLIH